MRFPRRPDRRAGPEDDATLEPPADAPVDAPDPDPVFVVDDPFVRERPSAQNAVDIFAGAWRSALPPKLNVVAGTQAYFEDRRVAWIAGQLGGLDGLSTLELGPYEAYNTAQLCESGAAPVVAIEANKVNFLKCLVVKELLDFSAEFRLGDFVPYLESTTERFDLCLAAGVLYHQTEPLRFLAGLGRVAPTVYFWTHYFDEASLRDTSSWNHFDPLQPVEQTHGGYTCTVYPRSYLHRYDRPPSMFSGGSSATACWMTKETIFDYLSVVGFRSFEIHRDVATASGPVVSFLARTS